MKHSTIQPFEIRLSRLATSLFVVAALLFLFVGFELLFGNDWLQSANSTAHPIVLYGATIIFFGLIPLSILIRLVPYLIHPPLLLRVDAEQVTFGTGFSYTPMTIPTKHITTVSAGVVTPDASTIRPENIVGQGGLVINFDTSANIPKAAVTSVGIRYSFGRLVISRIYANQGIQKSLAAIRPFILNKYTRR